MMKPKTKRAVLLIAFQAAVVAQACASDATLPELSLEDLTKTEITSVSRKTQSILRVPAAAFVISADDIARSGAQSLPDVLRMVPGIEVAQIDSGRYAVSARGFNGRFANKLQVLIDGRSIYHPIFSGVMWEHDAIALDDIERIEVIRGPGAAIWGVNAVSGVINIISKHSHEQPGGFVDTTAGTQGRATFYGRYAGAVDERTSWKLSVQGRHAEPSDRFSSDVKSVDRLNNALADLRMDRNLGGGSDLTLWANVTHSELRDLLTLGVDAPPMLSMYQAAAGQSVSGQVLAARYRWLTASGIESSVKTSFNASRIELEHFFLEDRNTYDVDYQGRYTFAAHDLVWGLSHRTTSNSSDSSEYIAMAHPNFTQNTTGVFIQDDWTLIPDRLQFGLGARRDHASVGGSTFAPNATLMWTPTRVDTWWAKYARAPRLPSQGEREVTMVDAIRKPTAQMPLPLAIRTSPGSRELESETLAGVELGYRTMLSPGFSIDLSGYRYRYNGRVAGRAGALDYASQYPYIVQNVSLCNCSDGSMSGVELSADWLVSPAWRLQLSYSWARVRMDDSADPMINEAGRQTENASPRHYGSLRSQWNISPNRQFDAWIRGSAGYQRTNTPYTDLVHVPGYVTLDLRYAFKLGRNADFALTGRNLVGAHRYEFVSDFVPSVPVEIGRSLLLTGRWRF